MKNFIYCFLLCLLPLTGSAEENPFVAGGVPATSREWMGRDYVATYQVLQQGKLPLPLLGDDNGSKVLQRLTNTANFSFHRNTSLPISQRLGDFLQMQGGFNAIFKMYAVEVTRGKPIHREAASLLAFGLHVAALGLELTREFVPTLPKDDQYEAKMQALKEMHGGLMTMVVGAESGLGDTKFYSDDDLILVLSAMKATLPTLQAAFSEEFRTEIRMKLERRKAAFQGKKGELLVAILKDLEPGPRDSAQPATLPESKSK